MSRAVSAVDMWSTIGDGWSRHASRNHSSYRIRVLAWLSLSGKAVRGALYLLLAHHRAQG